MVKKARKKSVYAGFVRDRRLKKIELVQLDDIGFEHDLWKPRIETAITRRIDNIYTKTIRAIENDFCNLHNGSVTWFGDLARIVMVQMARSPEHFTSLKKLSGRNPILTPKQFQEQMKQQHTENVNKLLRSLNLPETTKNRRMLEMQHPTLKQGYMIAFHLDSAALDQLWRKYNANWAATDLLAMTMESMSDPNRVPDIARPNRYWWVINKSPINLITTTESICEYDSSGSANGGQTFYMPLTSKLALLIVDSPEGQSPPYRPTLAVNPIDGQELNRMMIVTGLKLNRTTTFVCEDETTLRSALKEQGIQ